MEFGVAESEAVGESACAEVEAAHINRRMVAVEERLVDAGVEAAHGAVLLIGEAAEEGHARLDRPIQPAQEHVVLERGRVAA